jgi:hypothetical protein
LPSRRVRGCTDLSNSFQQNPSSESDTFVPKELGFQVKALSGEVISPTEGELSLLRGYPKNPANEDKISYIHL